MGVAPIAADRATAADWGPGFSDADNGGLGWLGDRYFHTAFLLPVGIVVGMTLSVILVIRRYGQVSKND